MVALRMIANLKRNVRASMEIPTVRVALPAFYLDLPEREAAIDCNKTGACDIEDFRDDLHRIIRKRTSQSLTPTEVFH